jgi:hypothetical protein
MAAGKSAMTTPSQKGPISTSLVRPRVQFIENPFLAYLAALQV